MKRFSLAFPLLLLGDPTVSFAEDLLSLKLEDLTQISLSSRSATLSKTALENTPASITIIDHKQIVESGARNLDELLEIYVPSFTYMYKLQGNQIGLRGIISDRNNKILLLVNGKNMNIKASDGGAVTEQLFSLLGDIKKVTVVNGSGSTIYGPGAIAGIISIETFSGETFRNSELNIRMGSREDFLSAEISIARKISSDMSYYFYYGIDKYAGADQEIAPEKFSFDFTFNNPALGQIVHDQPIDFQTTPNHSSLHQKPRQKFHAQLNGENFKVWLRYTYSSQEVSTFQNTIIDYLDRDFPVETVQNTGYENQQITLAGDYEQKILSNFSLNYSLSYMLSDVNIIYSQNPDETRNRYWGEDNINAKILASYTINKNNIFHFGTEYDYNKFGRKSLLNDSDESLITSLVATPGIEWDTAMYSLFGEYKYRHSKDTLVFLNMRADKHTYTSWMLSPRISIVHHFNDKHTLKWIASRSVRHSDDADLYKAFLNADTDNDTETLTSYELIYSYKNKNISFSFAPYYNIHDIVAFNDSNYNTENIGKVKYIGFDTELQYNIGNKILLYLSHSYVKLHNFTLKDSDITRQNISAQPYGYGDDFANWNNHITKLRLNYRINSQLKWTNSMQIFWGIPGAQDMSDYNLDLGITDSRLYKLPVLESDTAIQEHVYLNTGVTYKANNDLKITLNAYNLLGLVNKDYNIRNYFLRTSHYREMAPSVACRLSYKF